MKNNGLYFLFVVLIVLITGCATKESKQKTQRIKRSVVINSESWRLIDISARYCEKYNIPVVPFSIKIPREYKIELNPLQKGAIRFYKMNEDVIIHEISIATLDFIEEFNSAHEEEWLNDFKQNPEIQNNKDLSIKIIENIEVCNEMKSAYFMSLNNEFKKYSSYRPLNTIGFIFPKKDKLSGIVVALSKHSVNISEPLSDLEFAILSTFKFE